MPINSNATMLYMNEEDKKAAHELIDLLASKRPAHKISLSELFRFLVEQEIAAKDEQSNNDSTKAN